MIRISLLVLLVMQTLTAQQLTIAVAANVSYAIEELKGEFLKAHPETQIDIILGSSGKLSAQIQHGAPYGLFMSADMQYPQSLFDRGLAMAPPQVYAQGALALFSVSPRDFTLGLGLLADQEVETIALANPKTAPYGQAAIEAMEDAEVLAIARPKFIFSESISQTLSYALTAVHIGIISKAALYSHRMQAYHEGVHWKEIDIKHYEPIKQGIILLKTSHEEPLYKAFYDFVLSGTGQGILKKYGYII